MNGLPPFADAALGYIVQGWDIAKNWLLSPAAWSQFIILVIAYLAAV